MLMIRLRCSKWYCFLTSINKVKILHKHNNKNYAKLASISLLGSNFMKILFISSWYPSKEKPHQGLFVREHARAINSSNHEIVVLAIHVIKGKRIFKYKTTVINDQGIQTHHIEIHSFFHKKIYGLTPLIISLANRYLRKHILQTFNPDIVHSNVISPCGIIGWKLSKQIQKPHIITEHWSKTDHFFASNLWKKQGKSAYQDANSITTVSSFLKQKIYPHVENKKKIIIVPNVVDQSTFYFQPKTPNKKIVFSAIATWEYPKRPILFTDALQELIKTYNLEVELHLFGDGSLLKEIKEKHYNFDIHYRGYCNKETIASQLFKTDFFLHASDIETFSIVVAEALSTGTPVIASRVGAIPDLISNIEYGILCENDLSSWKEAIYRALKFQYNHNQISIDLSQKYSSESIGKCFSSIYTAISDFRDA
jgi:glycosyltransferase involved in cell wall biosynthesis